MAVSETAARRKVPMTVRLLVILSMTSVLLSMVVAALGADHNRRLRSAARHAEVAGLAAALAQRVAPHLERGDDLRLAMTAAAAADLGPFRILCLDKSGHVRLDTGLALGGKRLQVLSHSGAFQRPLDEATSEALAPARTRQRALAGEVRVRYATPGRAVADFSWSLFGTAFLASLSLVVLACLLLHHWLWPIREAAQITQRLARGELSVACRRGGDGAVADLQSGLQALAQGLREGFGRVEQGFVELATQLVTVLERRQATPPGHGERTARYALLLAARLDLLPEDRRELAIAARLHDIGKVALRPSLVRKEGPLSESERASLRQHADRGAALLAPVPSLQRVALAIRHHHEKYDGSGYPDGLRGDRIPLGSRILAIADAYDVLTSRGIWGVPLTWPEALDHLRQDRGEHFDPWLLDLFAEEVRRAPVPERPVRRVMISTAGVVPYKAAQEDGAAEDEEVDGDGDGDDGEIMELLECEVELMREDDGGGSTMEGPQP